MLFKFSAYGFLKNLRFFEPFLYLFFLENGLSFFQIGLLIGLREIFVNLMEIPTGAIADLTGRRRAMVFSFGSYIISFSIFYLTSSFPLFALAMILFAAGEAFRSGTHKSMIMEYLDSESRGDEKVAYYGKTRSASRLGSALSALLAALIVYFAGNYDVVFLATIFPYVLDLALMFTYPPELDGATRGKFCFLAQFVGGYEPGGGYAPSPQLAPVGKRRSLPRGRDDVERQLSIVGDFRFSNFLRSVQLTKTDGRGFSRR